jgi:hypothetical protein
MAMTVLEVEVRELRERVERLEERLERLTTGERADAPSAPLDQEQLLARLRADGLIVEPPSVLREHAAVWQALPEEERQAVSQGLDNVPASPMASDIIIEGRR